MSLAPADEQVAPWLDLLPQPVLDSTLLLDLAAFTVRPMDRAENSPRQMDLAAIDPVAAA
jgi:hypothetical protein